MTRVLGDRWVYHRTDESYWRHILREYRYHGWRRRQKLMGYTAADDWRQHCAGVRQRFRALLGPLPERTLLNPRRVDVLERDGYVVEKLLIESQPRFYVPVNLYLPTTAHFPAPTILNPVGHWLHAKAQEVVQARAIGLARKGYIAAVYDPIGQGERDQFPEELLHPGMLHYSTTQHAVLGLACSLIGQSIIGHMVWDGVRVLDYLETRPEVDATRFGCTGASGGGTYTTFLSAFDDRIKAAVPVCSTTTRERSLSQGSIGELCQDPEASIRDDLDTADLFLCAAPAALRIVVAAYDTFPLVGAQEVYVDVKAGYTALGVADRVDLVEVPSRHDYNRPMREAMYAWFNRWLGNPEADAVEAPYEAQPPERLHCTPTGRLWTSLGGETVLTVNRARARAVMARLPVPESREEAARQRAVVRAAVPKVLGHVGGPAYAPAKVLDVTVADGVCTEQVALESEPDLPIPFVLSARADGAPPRTVLLLDDRGKAAEADAGGLVPALVQAGCRVVAADLRGWGETAWKERFPLEPDQFDFLGSESLLAYSCYMLGAWPVSQRVTDAMRVIDYLASRDDVDLSGLAVVGRGVAGIVALHLAAADPRVAAVGCYETLAAYRLVIDADHFSTPASAFLPGVLLRYDLPDLAGALAPRPVWLANPLDALGARIDGDAATTAYAPTVRLHERLGKNGGVRLQTALNAAALSSDLTAWLQHGAVRAPATA